MKTKSLLLGSAAALFAVTGARAADAVIIPEPEVVEYVRVCDAAGTGYFYIPGTEVCLKISGYVNYDMEFADGTDARDDDYEARLQFDAWTDTEYGPLTTRIRTTAAGSAHERLILAQTTYFGSTPAIVGATSSLNVDRAYFELAGLRIGIDASAYDFDISGETDNFGAGNNTGVIRYTATVGATSLFVSLENDDQFPLGGSNNWTPNVVVGASGSFSDVSYTVAVAYDENGWITSFPGIGDMWSAKAMVSFMNFNVEAQYTSDADLTGVGTNAYAGPAEWYVAASYDFQATDKLLITPAVEYANDMNFAGVGSPDMWGVGVTAKYNITDTLWVRGHIEYNDPSFASGTWKGQIRFRSEF